MRSFFFRFSVNNWPTSRFSLVPWLVRGVSVPLTAAAIVNCSGSQVLGQEAPDSCDLVLPHTTNQKLDAATFWNELPESTALAVLKKQSTDSDLIFSSTPRENRQDLQLSLIEWLSLSDQPLPDVYQVNGGSDVLQFALDAPRPTTEICSLDSLDELYDFRSLYFEAAWRPALCQGSLYSVPLSVHRINTTLLNLDVYEEYMLLAAASDREFPSDGVFTSADSLLEFLEWAFEQDLETAAGAKMIPFALGIGADSSSSWPITLIAFENFLASYGNGIYESIWQGGRHAIPPEKMKEGVARLASHLRRLGAVSNFRGVAEEQLATTLNWQNATELVISGKALITISGDWIRSAVPENRRARVVTRIFPGTDGTFVYTPDSFSVPRRSDTDGSSAHAWFRDVIKDKGTQLRFAKAKQAIPSLVGLSEADLDTLKSNTDEQQPDVLTSDYLKNNYREFEDCQKPDSECRLLLAVSGLGPAGAHDPCFDQLALLLATITGLEYSQEIWAAHPCENPVPQSSAEAESALTELLLGVSAQPFASQCRADDSFAE